MIVITSLYGDPLHSGHLQMFANAKALGGETIPWVVAIVNNDEQAKLKKGFYFLPMKERCRIIAELKDVDEVVRSIDTDLSVSETLKAFRKDEPNELVIFFNEGDVQKGCREEEVCRQLGIQVIYGNDPKIRSSSDLIKEGLRRYLESKCVAKALCD